MPAAWPLLAYTSASLGAQVTVFDPDLDPGGRYARLLADILATGLGEVGTRRRRS